MPLGVVVSFSSLNVVGIIEKNAPESTQTSPLVSPASSAKRFGDAQFTYLPKYLCLNVLNSLWGVVHPFASTLGDVIQLLQICKQVLHEVDHRSLLKIPLVVNFLTSSSSLQTFQCPDPGPIYTSLFHMMPSLGFGLENVAFSS